MRELPGCFASGDNLDELREALQESLSLYFSDDLSRSKLADFRPMEVGEMKVLVGA